MISYIMFAMFIYGFLVVIGVIITIVKKGKIEPQKILLVTIPLYLMFAIIPFLFANSLFGNGFILLTTVTIIGYLVIRVGNNIYNKIKVRLSKDEGIYIRDIEVEYSPAVLSYLQNQKIEKKKDLVSCILNLCAKGFLKIEKKEENHYELEPLPNQNRETLKKDEKYLYDRICKKEKINMSTWIRYVREEFKSYHFTKENKIQLSNVFLFLYIAIMIILAIYSQITGNNQISDEMFNVIFVPFFVAFELVILEPLMRIIVRYLRKGEYLDGTYTTKGAKEMKRWDKYKKFLEDYTLLEDKPLESVMVLEKHLAYATVLNVNTSYTKSFIEQLKVTHKINLDDINNMLEEINKGA